MTCIHEDTAISCLTSIRDMLPGIRGIANILAMMSDAARAQTAIRPNELGMLADALGLQCDTVESDLDVALEQLRGMPVAVMASNVAGEAQP